MIRAGWLALLMPIVWPAGCADEHCDGATADAVYVRVVDATTAEPVDAEITALRDGEPTDVECIERDRGTDGCLVWAVGYMRTGTFEITVVAPLHENAGLTVDVGLGPCGPESQMRTVALTPFAGP